MEKGYHVFLKTFWDTYDLSPRLFVVSLFWLVSAAPWLVTAVYLYAAFPGIGTGALAMLPLLLLNPATWAAFRYAHAVLYHDTVPPFASFWRTWPRGAAKSQLALAVYLVPVLALHLLRYLPADGTDGALRAVPWLALVQLVLFLLMLCALPLIAPMEMFRPRPAREAVAQAFLILASHTLLCLSVTAAYLLLGFSVIRFGVMALVFVPITVVLGMNLLYYIYMKHGSMQPRPYAARSFRELLKPFRGKVSDE